MKKIAISGALSLAAALMVCPAAAITYHTTGGEDCQPVYNTNWVYGQNIFYGNGVHAYDATNAKFFSCPLSRTNGLSNTGLSAAFVDVYDSSNGGLWCQLYALDEYGNQVATSGVKYSGGTGQREIAFGSIATSDPWGSYSMFCTMAAATSVYNSYIYSYQWGER